MRAARLVGSVVTSATFFTALVVVHDAPALAQAANGLQDDSGIAAGASTPANVPRTEQVSTRPRGRGGPVPTCTGAGGTSGPVSWRAVPPNLLFETEKERLAQEGGSFVTRFCGEGLADAAPGITRRYRPPGGAGAPVVDPVELASEALERTSLPEPQIAMAPSSDIPQLVNLTTFLWLPAEQWQPETVSASAGGVTSTVTATPTRVVWDMGQGDTVVCDGPGVAYRPELPDDQQPSDCSYTYLRSSAGQPDQAYQVTATLEWETTWAVTGAPGGGSLGTATSSSSTSVRVAELQSLNVVPQ